MLLSQLSSTLRVLFVSNTEEVNLDSLATSIAEYCHDLTDLQMVNSFLNEETEPPLDVRQGRH